MAGNDDILGADGSQGLLPQSRRKYKGPKMSIIQEVQEVVKNFNNNR